MEVSGSKSIVDKLNAGELDFGICSTPPGNLMLEFEPLSGERLGGMLSVNHLLAGRDRIAVNDLTELTVLVKEPTCIYRDLWEREIYPTMPIPFSGIEVGSTSVIQQMVKEEFGVEIVPIYRLGKASLLLIVAIKDFCVPNDTE